MADINDLVQEFWSTSSDGDVGESLSGMRRLHEILEEYLEVSLYLFRFATAVDLADLQRLANPWNSDVDETVFRANFKILFDRYRTMFDQSLSNSKDLGDMLRLLPGVVVQNPMSMQGMTDLYGIKPDLLKCLFKSTIEPLHQEKPNFLTALIRSY